MTKEDDVREQERRWAHTGTAVIATAHELASQAGLAMFHQGGNAVDAAVAASFALSVCEPGGSGLGGMALAVVHLADAAPNTHCTFTVEGSCVAPKRATPVAVAASHRYRGYRAAAVPRHVAAMKHLLDRYGSLPAATVLQPAIDLAEHGFAITKLQHELTCKYRRALTKHSARRLLLDARGEPLPQGTQLRQPVLAATLRRLAEAGLQDFYVGDIARRIDEDMRARDGFVRLDDLAEALEVREGEALRGALFDWEVRTMGPPGGGLALLEMCGLASVFGPDRMRLDIPQGVVRTARCIRQARMDRMRYRLRTGTDAPGEAAELLDPHHLRTTAHGLEQDIDTGETSHLCVIDQQGNAVSLTQSIERTFGSAELGPELGFLYNGFLRAFKVENQRHPHYLTPGKVARSNAAPTIVTHRGVVQAIVGATGSERSTSAILCTLLRLRVSSPFEAVRGPRLHATPDAAPDAKVLIEGERFPPPCLLALEKDGMQIVDIGPYAFQAGGLQLVARLPDGTYRAVADPRRDGAAAGL